MLVAATLAARVLVAPLGAQTRPDTTRRAPGDSARGTAARVDPDSLAARLARAEAAIALLRQQLGTESESAVRARSRVAFEVSARLLTNTSWTSRATDDRNVPSFAVPEIRARAGGVVGLSVRQTRVGAGLVVRGVLGGTLDADADVDFYGGTRDANGDRPLFPEPRLRTAGARLAWPSGFVVVGAETPLVSDLDPRSLAAVGVPVFGAAGNLWNWLPQVRASRELVRTGRGRGAVRWAVQGAVLMPYAGTSYAPPDSTLPPAAGGDPYAPSGGSGGDAAERSGRPSLETRLRARWGPEDPDAPPQTDIRDFGVGEGPSEVGVGLHRGWLRLANVGLVDAGAVTADARIAFARHFELRAEAYGGQLLAGLGGGAVGQNFGATAPGAPAGSFGSAVRTVAGWAQVNAQATRTFVAGIGCGIDHPRRADHPDRERNAACATHVRWQPAQPLVLGVEYRRLATRYAGGRTFAADHLNLALGVEL
ncbi:hypothetical protein tb265_07650 [Gemmatimonadetes bacterium T265]|nr:hypothetical protein tb265_07650 [Gemmatimonadetes bacterium T265]